MWVVYAIIAAVFWGMNYALTEKVLHSIAPVTLLALEMFVGTLVFSVASYFTTWAQDKVTLASQPDVFWLTIAEIVVLLLGSFFIIISIYSKNATVAGIIELIYPLFIILFTWLFFGENHVNASVVIGGMFIFVGVLIIGLTR